MPRASSPRDSVVLDRRPYHCAMTAAPTPDAEPARKAWGPRLAAAILADQAPDPIDVVDRFLAWAAASGLAPYDHQVEALSELAAGRHVIISTPTGSGKSLVALGLHTLALAAGQRSFYTSPTKALASEKFFQLCDILGAARVGMLTGDASVNPAAPVICCTAEVLSSMALRDDADRRPAHVVMDEFHFYGDADRGTAWQVPLVMLPTTRFLLMSATLGDVAGIAARLRDRTGRDIAVVHRDARPVPLDFTWRETPIHETVQWLVDREWVPAYLVSFTHRACGELAGNLTSQTVAPRADRERIAARLSQTPLDTPFGRELRRYLGHGIGIHHAGMLPKYRLLVEQLAQAGLLKVICGTDTLGVGVNVPLRTVVFTALAKFDGRQARLLGARDFRQIAGRSGRKGFDDVGHVVAQASPHVIENARLAQKAAGGRKNIRRKQPPPGAVQWSRAVFEDLVRRPIEPLTPHLRLTHGLIVDALRRTADPAGYAAVVTLIRQGHQPPAAHPGLLREAAALFRSLRRAGLVEVARVSELGTDRPSPAARVYVDPELQPRFAMRQALSLFLVDAILALDRKTGSLDLDIVSLVEAILEDPVPILKQQQRHARAAIIAQLKAEGVPFEERQAQVEAVTYPRPLADFVERRFAAFAARHPWVRADEVRPKSIARDLLEHGLDFPGYVKRYDLQRSEGLLLRHLSHSLKVLLETVPPARVTPALATRIDALRAVVVDTDASLVEAWERLDALERGDTRGG